MSSFRFNVSGVTPINVNVTGNSAKTIVDGTNNAVFVDWFEVNENGGGTQNLTVDIYDGTNARPLGDDAGATWTAKAVTAKQSVKFTKGYAIPIGSVLRVTSSDAAGKFNVHGLQVRSGTT